MSIDPRDDAAWARYLQKQVAREQRGNFPKPVVSPGDALFNENIRKRHARRDFEPYRYSGGSAAIADAE